MPDDETGARLKQQEQTGPQTTGMLRSIARIGRELTNPLPKSYATYRTMRTDPTIALARALIAAPVVAAEWGFEADDDAPEDAVKLIQDIYEPARRGIISAAMYGGMDFGWQGLEQVFGNQDGATIVAKFKPLLQDITTILVDDKTGEFKEIQKLQITHSNTLYGASSRGIFQE